MQKLELLRAYIGKMVPEGICLAVSGGVDSAFLLRLLSEFSGDFPGSVLYVSFLTELQSEEDQTRIKELEKKYPKMEQRRFFLDLLADPVFAENPPDRCYRCKRNMFHFLKELSARENKKWILDGTQADDLGKHRPGLKALEEFGVRSPLAECGIGKEEIRYFSRHLGLSDADSPAGACLATRLPHGVRLVPEVLRAIGQGEIFLKSLGFPIVRIRLHGDLARIEVPEEDFLRILQQKSNILESLQFLPARYFCLDLSGFFSGSMDLPETL